MARGRTNGHNHGNIARRGVRRQANIDMKNARDQTPRVVGVPAGIRAEIYSKRFRQPVSPMFSMLGDIERQLAKCAIRASVPIENTGSRCPQGKNRRLAAGTPCSIALTILCGREGPYSSRRDLYHPLKISAATVYETWNLRDCMAHRPLHDGHFHPLLWRSAAPPFLFP